MAAGLRSSRGSVCSQGPQAHSPLLEGRQENHARCDVIAGVAFVRSKSQVAQGVGLCERARRGSSSSSALGRAPLHRDTQTSSGTAAPLSLPFAFSGMSYGWIPAARGLWVWPSPWWREPLGARVRCPVLVLVGSSLLRRADTARAAPPPTADALGLLPGVGG